MPRLCCLVLALGLMLSSRAAADPLTVTSGFVIFTDEPGEFLLTGSGFSVGGSWFPRTVSGTFWFDRCSPCLPGSTVDYGETTYDFSTDDRSTLARGTINGVTYPEVFYDAQVTFRGPTVIAPPLDLDGRTIVTGPFTLTGRVAAFDNEARSGTPLFSADLLGAGIADAFFGTFDEGGRSAVYVTDLEYRFEDQAPVPEPSTIMLLATGLAAAVARRRRRLSHPA